MKPQAVHLRIARLVIDADLGANLSPHALAGAIQAELSSRGQSQRAQPDSPVARSVADGVSTRLSALNVDAGLPGARGGRNGAL
jgi:hypothetical protein